MRKTVAQKRQEILDKLKDDAFVMKIMRDLHDSLRHMCYPPTNWYELGIPDLGI